MDVKAASIPKGHLLGVPRITSVTERGSQRAMALLPSLGTASLESQAELIKLRAHHTNHPESEQNEFHPTRGPHCELSGQVLAPSLGLWGDGPIPTPSTKLWAQSTWGKNPPQCLGDLQPKLRGLSEPLSALSSCIGNTFRPKADLGLGLHKP